MRLGIVLAVVCGVSGLAHGDDLAKARAYFRAGVEAYDSSRYEVALREFQHSHALSHNPALYFNMAACEEHLDHFQAAALLLRQYLIENPAAEDREKVEARIHVLEERDEAMKRPPPEPPTTAPQPATAPAAQPGPPPGTAKPRRVISWALLGVTGALGVGAIGAGAWSLTRFDDLKAGCGATPAGCSTSEKDGVHAGAVATDVLIGLTAAAAVTTVVMFVLEPRLHKRPNADHARLQVTPAGMVF